MFYLIRIYCLSMRPLLSENRTYQNHLVVFERARQHAALAVVRAHLLLRQYAVFVPFHRRLDLPAIRVKKKEY